MSKKIATYGMLVALAFLLGWIETLIPFSFAVPGMKLGLANLATIAALYGLGAREALAVSLVRIVLTGFTFGNASMMLYSLAGGLLSLLCMIPARKCRGLGIVGVSVIGGVAHNLGQLLLAAAALRTRGLLYYFPALLIAGSCAGFLIGVLGGLVLERIQPVLSGNGGPLPGRRKRIGRGELYLAVLLAATAALVFLGYRLTHRGTALEAVVQVGEEEYARLSLEQDTELLIEGKNGGTNLLVIADGTADILDADCADRLCVHQKAISRKGETLVCMPHQVIVSVE